MSQFTKVTLANFTEEVLESELPVILYFSTDGCGPCEAIVPVLKDIESDFEDQLLIKNVHVTFEEGMNGTNPIVEENEIMAYPTLLLFTEGKPVKYIIGKYTKSEIIDDVEKVITLG